MTEVAALCPLREKTKLQSRYLSSDVEHGERQTEECDLNLVESESC